MDFFYKKITLFPLITFFAINVGAQNPELQKYIGGKAVATKSKSNSGQKISVVTVDSSNELYKAGAFLEQSAKMQYYSIGFGAAAGLIFWSMRNEDDRIRYICGGIAGIASIACGIMSINYKIKAGRSIKIGASGSGGSIAYVF